MKGVLGRRIKEIRESKGLKAKYVAAKVGISHNYLSSIENGKRKPARDTLQAIAQVIGVTRAELINKQSKA